MHYSYNFLLKKPVLGFGEFLCGVLIMHVVIGIVSFASVDWIIIPNAV